MVGFCAVESEHADLHASIDTPLLGFQQEIGKLEVCGCAVFRVVQLRPRARNDKDDTGSS